MRLADLAAAAPMPRSKPTGDEQALEGADFGLLITKDRGSGKHNRLERDNADAALAGMQMDDISLPTLAARDTADSVEGPVLNWPTAGEPGDERDLATEGQSARRAFTEPSPRIAIDWLSLGAAPRPDQVAPEALPADGDELDLTETDQQLPDVEGKPEIASMAADAEPAAKADAVVAGAIQAKPVERAEEKRSDPAPLRDAPAPLATKPVESLGRPVAVEGVFAKPVAPSPEVQERPDDGRMTSRPPIERASIEPDLAAARPGARLVTAVSSQTVPAPALVLQGPAQTVVASLGEEVREIARPAAVQNGQPQTSEPMRILKIQLHPLELGTVTARLSLQGGGMTVELQAETREAASKLATDSTEIAKALRGLGIEIDRVTVTQAPSNQTQTQDQSASPNRGHERFDSEGTSGDGAERRPHPGASSRDSGLEAGLHVNADSDHSGVYI